MKHKHILIILIILLTACTPATPDAGAIETAIAQTQAAQPTAIPPTETPVPTATLDSFELTKQVNQTQNAAYQSTVEANATIFALTPSKTPTPQATKTPVPTATPTFAPLILTGTGDSIVDVDLPDNFVGIVHITGNASSRYFGVSNLDANNEQIDLLVNTGDPYDGVRPLDFLKGEETVRFEVQAVGEWTIEVLPISMIKAYPVTAPIMGTGDDVIRLIGSNLDTAIITGNPESRYFGIQGFSDSGIDLLVNTGDPYNGTVILDPTTFILVIQAIGEWSIQITTK